MNEQMTNRWNYRDFFSNCEFKLVATTNSNWDYYTMQHQDKPFSIVAIANKQGKEYGCHDSQFGDLQHLKNVLNKTKAANYELTAYGKSLIYT